MSEAPRSDSPSIGELLYLHCIVEFGSTAHHLLDQGLVPGIEPTRPLIAITHGRLVAACSRVTADQFGETALASLSGDLPRLAALALRHQQAITALMDESAGLVPLSFGSVFRGEERVTETLREREAELAQMVERFRALREYDVKLSVDSAQLEAALARTESALPATETRAESAAEGKRYLLRRQLEQERVERKTSLLDEVLGQVEGQARTIATDVRREDLVDDPSQQHHLLLKAACLLNSDQLAVLTDRLQAIRASYADLGFSLTVSGPWPPYSFVSG